MNKISFLLLFLFFSVATTYSQHITILHTNDMHSRITGDGPEADYSPLIINNDSVLGGFARLATLLDEQKAKNPDGTLILDAGDFLMGTLFNTIEPETGFQLNMMKNMGYDFVTIGNHEFDYGPNTLADIINAAKKRGGIPTIISSNLTTVPGNEKDEKLDQLFKNNTILPYKIITVKGLKIGIIGILGINASDVAPNKAPVTVEKQIKTAKRISKMLKKEKDADLVICLSHSGIYPDGKGGYEGEDIKMAKKAKFIDVIISGHTHVKTPEPVKVKNTLVVQTGCFLHNLGKLDLIIKDGKIVDYGFELLPVNDGIKGNEKINASIENYKNEINNRILFPLNLSYNDTIAETSFNLMKYNKKGYRHANLGVFVADVEKYYVDTYGGGTDITLIASGTIRDNLLKGITGIITVPDIFRVMSLGRASENLPGYPLAKIYVTGHELKNLMEVLLLSNSDDGYIFVSGLKAWYNPKKMMLRKVYKIEVDGKPVDLSKKSKKLYGITSDTYLLGFISQVKHLSKGLVNLVPKTREGKPVEDINDVIIDFDEKLPGIQPGTEWLGIVRYMKDLKDINGNGIPDIPLKYNKPLSNRIEE